MRLIFLCLLLANMSYFAYQYFVPKEQKEVLQQRNESVDDSTSARLLLLSEQATELKFSVPKPKVQAEEKVVVAEKKEVDVPQNDLCTMIGPYDELLQAEYTVERLAALGVGAQITTIEIRDGDAYWVYLAPELSEKEALRRLYELQGKNIESYLITKGELSNGISFGRYADSLEANERMKAVRDLGYDAQIKSMPKTINETWVMLNVQDDEKVSKSVWDELLSQKQNYEKRQNFCLGVASK